MQIKHTKNENRGHFTLTVKDEEAGLMTYVNVKEHLFIIDHTEVNDAYTKQGYGEALVMEAVKYARENHKKIMPLCPFAKSVFQRRADINDVLFHP